MTEMNNLPQPSGWRILLEMPAPEEKTKSGLYIPKQVQDNEKILGFMGEVKAMGPLCYKRDDMKDGPPWCKVGDNVLISRYAGTKLVINDREYRIINDDEVQATGVDPSVVKRG